MAEGEFLILLLVVEQSGAALIVVAGAVMGDPVRDLGQVEFLSGAGQGRACRHIVQGVFRADTLHSQDPVESGAQLGEEGERSAQVYHVALDLPALGQTGNGLIHHGGEDALGDIVFLSALVQKGLDVAFGEHAAAGGNAVRALALPGDVVKLCGGDVQQGGHLVDEGAGAAGAGAVHPHFHGAGEEQDLGVLTPQLDDHVGVRYVLFHSGPGGVHFLDEGDVQILCQAHARRTGNAEERLLFLGELFLDAGEHPGGLLCDLGVVPLVLLIYRLILPVIHHTFQGGGAHVQTDLHFVSIILSKRSPSAGGSCRRKCVCKKFQNYSKNERIFKNLS
ncbi:unknown [Clostridium sp. CAG:1013]|nr:unknown [Clostridium sp. CAG:1013]